MKPYKTLDFSESKDVIKATNVLPDEDITFIEQNVSKLQDNWAKNQLWRTETEMRVSVLNDFRFATAGAKYWQAVREQAVFYEQLIMESFEYRRNEIKLQRLYKKLQKAKDKHDELRADELQIDIEELSFRRLNLQRQIKDRVREVRLWDKIMEELVEQDPTFDIENVDNHQLISYMARWTNQLQILRQDEGSEGELATVIGVFATGLRLMRERDMKLPAPIREEAQNWGLLKPNENLKVASPKPTPIAEGIRASFDINTG